MSYTDAAGNTYSASYWVVAQSNLSQANSTGRGLFLGYKDQSSRQAGMAPVGQHSYDINSSDFATYFTPNAIDPLNVNPVSQMYTYSSAVQDTVVTPAVYTNGVITTPAVMASFFANATSV